MKTLFTSALGLLLAVSVQAQPGIIPISGSSSGNTNPPATLPSPSASTPGVGPATYSVITGLVASTFAPFRSAIITNAALANALAGNGVYVSKAYGSDTNLYPGPYYTLAAAGSNAAPGQTVFALDGTYVENMLYFPGVNWWLADGVSAYSTNTALWVVTNSAFQLGGNGSLSNSVLVVGSSTNYTHYIRGKTWAASSSSLGLVQHLTAGGCLSNKYIISFSAAAGKNGGGTLLTSPAMASETNVTEIFIESPAPLTIQPFSTTGATVTTTNFFVSITCPLWLLAGNGTFNNAATFLVNARRCDREATTQTTAINRAIWVNTFAVTTNSLSTAVCTNSRGSLIISQ